MQDDLSSQTLQRISPSLAIERYLRPTRSSSPRDQKDLKLGKLPEEKDENRNIGKCLKTSCL